MPPSRPLRLLAASALLSVGEGVSVHHAALRAPPAKQDVSVHDAALRAPPAQDALRLGGVRRSSTAKTMSVEGHTVSDVSARWTGKVVYAIFTSAIPRYHEKLVTQLETWAAKPAAEGRYIAVGGDTYPEEWQTGNILKSKCGDAMGSISCKEATLLAEGAARGADWLVVVGEDNYVSTGNVEAALADKDPSENIAFGVVGCGTGLYCKDVDAFSHMGGFCGGAGYIIARGALQQLLANGATALHKVYDNTTDPNDMTTSCELRRSSTALQGLGGMNGFPMFSIQEHESAIHTNFLTVHYLLPAVMRWMHAEIVGAEASEKQRLMLEAFDHGCAKGMDNTFWHNQWMSCATMNANLPGPW